MEINQILADVNVIFKDILDNDEFEVNETSTAGDEWDSLTNIQLVAAIEKHFKIRFTSAEISSWMNVGEMLNAIKSKLDTKSDK